QYLYGPRRCSSRKRTPGSQAVTSLCHLNGTPLRRRRESIRAPFCISTDGVNSRKSRNDGVICCRLRASQKNPKTVSRGAGTPTRVSSLYGIEGPFYVTM